MYEDGQIVPQDLAEAASWFRKAAEQNNAAAQFNLGRMYENGRGVAQDFVAAMHWYRRASDRGDAAAQFNLGTLYCSGRGGTVDYVEAHKWLALAASRFPAAEKEQRNRAVQKGTLVASRMTTAQIAEAQRREREWKPI